MLNSKKLLYIFSDVAYVAELLPAKKKGDFVIQEFRQINGDFLDNDTFIEENIEKLFSKLNKEEYLLVLPDFFFTNTILEVKEKAKTKIDSYINEELLPSLDISNDTHQVEHFVLTQYGEKSNVQLSAVERSLLAPIYEAAHKHEVKVAKTVSLSWTIKALISLEPSLSLVQMGENIYLVQHYIGIDQATSASITDVEKIAETIKTLKGAEPSIQTVYLLTNELVEEKLKELLKSTLPLQQLSDFKDEKSEIPSYVKQAIEAGAKTLSVTDFNVPDFKVEKVDLALLTESKKEAGKKEKEEDLNEKEVDEKTAHDDREESKSSEKEPPEELLAVSASSKDEEPLPEPTAPPVNEEAALATAVPTVVTVGAGKVAESVSEDTSVSESTETEEDTENDFDKNEEKDDILEKSQSEEKYPMPEDTKDQTEKETAVAEETESSLSKFAVVGKTIDDAKKSEDKEDIKPAMKEEKKEAKKEVIKNKTGVSSMLRMVFVSVAVFFLTVGIGVGLGLGYLTLSNSGATPEEDQTAVVVEQTDEEATPEPSPSPSPTPEIDKAEISILVVNATTKAGYAGDIQDLLLEADFEDVDAANAKGDYEDGYYVLMSEENTGLIDLIEEATDLEFDFSDEIKTEDIQGKYDAVVVLAE